MVYTKPGQSSSIFSYCTSCFILVVFVLLGLFLSVIADSTMSPVPPCLPWPCGSPGCFLVFPVSVWCLSCVFGLSFVPLPVLTALIIYPDLNPLNLLSAIPSPVLCLLHSVRKPLSEFLMKGTIAVGVCTKDLQQWRCSEQFCILVNGVTLQFWVDWPFKHGSLHVEVTW